MRILISNDDGIYSPGIAALAEVASGFGDVRIVAPEAEQSSASNSITASRPLSYRKTQLPKFEAYRVNGTPADSVALGIFLWEGVDLVLSGINRGTNLGNSIWHSGTLAAAKQASLMGIRGIAFSTPVSPSGGEPQLASVIPYVEKTLQILLAEKELPLLNVNIPEQPKGICWTRQSVRHYDGKVVAGKDPMGRENYWYTVVPIEEVEEGTDRWAMEKSFVSITPLRLDLTDDDALAGAKKRLGCQADGQLQLPTKLKAAS